MSNFSSTGTCDLPTAEASTIPEVCSAAVGPGLGSTGFGLTCGTGAAAGAEPESLLQPPSAIAAPSQTTRTQAMRTLLVQILSPAILVSSPKTRLITTGAA